MKRSKIVLLAGSLCLAAALGAPAAAQAIRNFKCVVRGNAVSCVQPSTPCRCVAGFSPYYEQGIQVGVVSWCFTRGPCP